MTVTCKNRLTFLDSAVCAPAKSAPGRVCLVVLAPAESWSVRFRRSPQYQALGIKQVRSGGFLRLHAA
jgi:hypothetical protein